MQMIKIDNYNDSELCNYIRQILKGEVVLDTLHNETPSYRVYNLYQAQENPSQQKLICDAIFNILATDFIETPRIELDIVHDQLLANLAFLCEALQIESSYVVLRALLDRGSLTPARKFFCTKETEKKILRALIRLQPPRLLMDNVWFAYWDADVSYFWDIAFLGISKSNIDTAINFLFQASERWLLSKEFDFPQALWQLINDASDKQLATIRTNLSKHDPEIIHNLYNLLKLKGLSIGLLRTALPSDESVYPIGEVQVYRKKPFYIYYHRDMDGISSAVTLSLFLIKKYEHSINNIVPIPVDFDQQAKWNEFDIQQPAAIVDFLYHPKAIIYYDHHQRPFISDDFELSFQARKQDVLFRLEKGALSATRLMFTDLKDFFKESYPDDYPQIVEMVNQVDRIDTAQFQSVDEWFKSDLPCIKLNRILQYCPQKDSFLNDLVFDLIRYGFIKILNIEKYKILLHEADNKQEQESNAIKDRLNLKGCVVFYNSVKPIKVPFLRFLPYKFFPQSSFTVAIYEKRDIAFEVSVGKNPWNTPSIKVNIGDLCNSFGGGGHKDVGGISFDNYDIAFNVSQRLVRTLQELPYNSDI